MRAVVATIALVVVTLASQIAWACTPAIFYDWALPAESGCVAFAGAVEQYDSPTVDITNNCATTVTVTAPTCPECDTQAVIASGATAPYIVHGNLGHDEDAMFALQWADEEGSSGMISGTVSLLEGAEDTCGNDKACTVVPGAPARSGSWLAVLAAIGFVARRRR